MHRKLAVVLILGLLLAIVGAIPGLADGPEDTETEVVRYEQGYRFERNGWIYLHIQGEPYDRGFQHGYLMAPELEEILSSMKYLTYWDTGKEWEFFVEAGQDLFLGHIDSEYVDEMKGIAAGAQEADIDITFEDILTWNGYVELTDYWWPNEKVGKYASGAQPDKTHCSAFIATGSATNDEQVVIAHNSWDNFETGQNANLIVDILPTEGHRVFMQSQPGYINSMQDFFVTDVGIMGTETTLGGFSQYEPNEAPEFYRARKAMQYAEDLDGFVALMAKENNGGYANSWLLGNWKTGEIMRFELGLKYQNVERTDDGYFIGFNAPIDPRIRNLESSNTGYADIRRHQGARQVRLTQLMEEHYGQIDVEIGKEILADHYDVYLDQADHPSSRTVDGHYELDAREYMSQAGRPLPYQARGAVDGKVMDSSLAEDMSFWARWGNSSGMPFDAAAFLAEHIQWSHLDGYLKDRPSQPWTLFGAGDRANEGSYSPDVTGVMETLIGKWEYTGTDVESTFEFKADGTLITDVGGNVNQTDFEIVDKDTFSMSSWKGNLLIDFERIGEDTLNMSVRGATVVYERVE